MRWLWYFIIYSFIGFLLEVAFARAIRHPKRDRKCLLLLPLCPVYGLGACLILLLAPAVDSPLWVALAGGLAATGAELAMGAFYRFALGVEFWDYTGIPGSLGGLVCPAFSACWTALSLALVYAARPLRAGIGRAGVLHSPAPDGYHRHTALVRLNFALAIAGKRAYNNIQPYERT